MLEGFSANLGFLWTDRSLPDAIRAARRAGFDAVELHFPAPAEAPAIRAALAETGLPLVSLNTRPGDRAAGDFGLAAVPGREAEAEAAIRDALRLAAGLGARAVHVMAGIAEERAAARATLLGNLRLAAGLAAEAGIGILIEPINRDDVPGYHLTRVAQAIEILETLDAPNVRMMADCYHVQRTEGDVARRLGAALPWIGHVQIASVPDRAEPDTGELAYPWLLSELARLGYDGLVGAEYRPAADTEAGLRWLPAFRLALGGALRRR